MSTRTRAGVAEGSMFVSPKKVFGARKRPGLQSGPLILDNRAEPVWFAPLSDGNVSDFRVQSYRGRPVLTWWQGRQVLGSGEGIIQMVDSAYRSIRRVRAGNDYSFDFHEAVVTEQGTLLGLVYNPVDLDLRSVGGPRDGRVVDGIVQEVDIATGRVLFEWHSLGNVALQEGYGPVPRKRRGLYDYFHVNAIGIDTDGNLLVSGRETWSVLKLDRRTGATIWRLGGKRSDFRLPRSGRFAWQHDAQRAPDGTIRIFDNEAAPKVRSRSRVLWLALDEANRTARVARSAEHPAGLLAGTQGNAQALPNGNTFVGWGSQGYFTEYGAGGRVLFDARVARGNDTYRAYRFPWSGTPGGRPALAARAPRQRAHRGMGELERGDAGRGLAGAGRRPARRARARGLDDAQRLRDQPRRAHGRALRRGARARRRRAGAGDVAARARGARRAVGPLRRRAPGARRPPRRPPAAARAARRAPAPSGCAGAAGCASARAAAPRSARPRSPCRQRPRPRARA